MPGPAYQGKGGTTLPDYQLAAQMAYLSRHQGVAGVNITGLPVGAGRVPSADVFGSRGNRAVEDCDGQYL